MSGWTARIRAGAGPLALLAALALAAGVLVVGTPRAVNELTDVGLRHDISQLAYTARDLTFRGEKADDADWGPQQRLQEQQAALQPALRDRIVQSWWAASTQLEKSPVRGTGLPEGPFGNTPPLFAVRRGSGLEERVDLVDGRFPQTTTGGPVEVVLTKWNAEKLKQRVGSTFRFGFYGEVPMKVVGLVVPHDEQDTFWEPVPFALRTPPAGDDEPYRAVLYSDEAGLAKLVPVAPVYYEFRYRISTSSLDLAVLPELVEAASVARRQGLDSMLLTSLDSQLARFADEVRAAQALLAVVQVGALVTLAGLALLASWVMVSRRRAELGLLRARGGAIRALGIFTLLETLLVVPAAVAGGLLGTAVTGRPAVAWPALAAFTALAVLAVPVMAMFVARDPSSSAGRGDTATARVGVKRRTAELSLLVLAGLGVWLVRSRGLSSGGGVDFYLAAVPALLAVAAALAMVRAVPPVVSRLSRLTARGDGLVAFLGLSRAGRTAGAVIGPVAVLVVAVSTAVFSIAVAGALDTARDRATDLRVSADVKVDGYYFDEAAAAEFAAVPGVTAVSPYMAYSSADLMTGGQRQGTTYALVLDAPSYTRVLAQSGVVHPVPAALRDAAPGSPLPAVVSPEAAGQLGGLGGKGTVAIRGRYYEFTVAAVVEGFPPIRNGAANFVVLPWQAIPADAREALLATGYLIAGDPDPQRLREVGDAAQNRWANTGFQAVDFMPETTVTTWEQSRAAMEASSVNAVVTFAYAIGAGAGVALALLAIGFAVVSGAR
ncbi:hypothetical protein, partial [Catellatospora coxensis]